MIAGPLRGDNFTILPGTLELPLILTCEHASNTVPEDIDLGIDPALLQEHWAWDLGIWAALTPLADAINVTVIGSSFSRLVIDLNRDVKAPSLIVDSIQGQEIKGNAKLSTAEREARIKSYYDPYHDAVDVLCQAYATKHAQNFIVIAMHSFTPKWSDQDRDFDIGVLFDDHHEKIALDMLERLTNCGFRVRANEPYSGKRGEIYSAHRHGVEHSCAYFELEFNQALLGKENLTHSLARSLRALALGQART